MRPWKSWPNTFARNMGLPSDHLSCALSVFPPNWFRAPTLLLPGHSHNMAPQRPPNYGPVPTSSKGLWVCSLVFSVSTQLRPPLAKDQADFDMFPCLDSKMAGCRYPEAPLGGLCGPGLLSKGTSCWQKGLRHGYNMGKWQFGCWGPGSEICSQLAGS